MSYWGIGIQQVIIKRTALVFMITMWFFHMSLSSQDNEALVITPTDGLYNSWNTLISKSPMNTMGVEKVALNRKMKKNKDYSICKIRYDVNKELISTAYAIVTNGEIFINSLVVHSNQHKHEQNYNIGIPQYYYKVAMQGRYWYLDGVINTSNTGTIIGGVLGGGVGVLIGSAIDGKYSAGAVGIIYDPQLRTYSSIKKCDELRKFSIQHNTGKKYPCIGQKFTHHQVRQFVFKLNSAYLEK